MTANELRIGNWINNVDNLYQIEDAEALLDVETFINHGAFQPIPLNEEWLIKFGFSFENSQHPEIKGFWHNRLNNFNFYFEQFPDNSFNYCAEDYVPLTTVNQLQNLYFALTGKELEIK